MHRQYSFKHFPDSHYVRGPLRKARGLPTRFITGSSQSVDRLRSSHFGIFWPTSVNYSGSSSTNPALVGRQGCSPAGSPQEASPYVFGYLFAQVYVFRVVYRVSSSTVYAALGLVVFLHPVLYYMYKGSMVSPWSGRVPRQGSPRRWVLCYGRRALAGWRSQEGLSCTFPPSAALCKARLASCGGQSTYDVEVRLGWDTPSNQSRKKRRFQVARPLGSKAGRPCCTDVMWIPRIPSSGLC